MGGQILGGPSSSNQFLPIFWSFGGLTQKNLLDSCWILRGQTCSWDEDFLCFALLKLFFTIKAHQISCKLVICPFTTQQKLEGSSRDPSWARGPLESWWGEWQDRRKYTKQKLIQIYTNKAVACTLNALHGFRVTFVLHNFSLLSFSLSRFKGSSGLISAGQKKVLLNLLCILCLQ